MAKKTFEPANYWETTYFKSSCVEDQSFLNADFESENEEIQTLIQDQKTWGQSLKESAKTILLSVSGGHVIDAYLNLQWNIWKWHDLWYENSK